MNMDIDIIDIRQLVKSKYYSEACAAVRSWKARLETAAHNELQQILGEKTRFFKKMQKSNPDLYILFQISDKGLEEKIYEKLTGIDVIFD